MYVCICILDRHPHRQPVHHHPPQRPPKQPHHPPRWSPAGKGREEKGVDGSSKIIEKLKGWGRSDFIRINSSEIQKQQNFENLEPDARNGTETRGGSMKTKKHFAH